MCNQRNAKVTASLLGIVMLLWGCSPAVSPPVPPDTAGLSEPNALAPSEQPTALWTPTPPGLLFSDDFNNPLSGWDFRRDLDAITDYADGEFVIYVGRPDTALWSNANRYMTDVRIEVDARQVAGPDHNLYGVICRYQDADNFYRFVIAGDGYAGITKRSHGDVIVISGPHLAISPAVQLGTATNHLEAVCQGPQLSLLVNGELVAQAWDGEFPAGDTGLIASAGMDPGVEIRFDNYSVSLP